MMNTLEREFRAHGNDASSTPAVRALDWFAAGWRLFRVAPIRIFGLLVLLFAVEGLLQLAIPSVGVPLSKWAVGVVAGVIWLNLAFLDQSGKLQMGEALRRVAPRSLQLAAIALLPLLVFGVQLGVAWLVADGPGVAMLLFGEMIPLDALSLGAILASGVPLSTLFMFAIPMLLLEETSVGEAIRGSAHRALRYWKPMCMLMAVTMLLIALAPVTIMLSVLLTGPWLLCAGYAAYGDTQKKD